MVLKNICYILIPFLLLSFIACPKRYYKDGLYVSINEKGLVFNFDFDRPFTKINVIDIDGEATNISSTFILGLDFNTKKFTIEVTADDYYNARDKWENVDEYKNKKHALFVFKLNERPYMPA